MIKNIFLIFLVFLSFSVLEAIVGSGSQPDNCGLTNPQPGQAFDPDDCEFPAVGTIIVDLSGHDEFAPGNENTASGGFIGICSGSLIYKDDNKAVFVTAGHCNPILPDTYPTYISFNRSQQHPGLQ